MARTAHARKRKPQHPAELKLERIRGIIDRAKAESRDAFGTLRLHDDQLTTAELQSIYRLAGGKVGR